VSYVREPSTTPWLLAGSYRAFAQTPLGVSSISETWEFQPIFADE
jgi:hypothetical protein